MYLCKILHSTKALCLLITVFLLHLNSCIQCFSGLIFLNAQQLLGDLSGKGEGELGKQGKGKAVPGDGHSGRGTV